MTTDGPICRLSFRGPRPPLLAEWLSPLEVEGLPTETAPSAVDPSPRSLIVSNSTGTVFVGREPEMDALVEALGEAISGPGGLFLIAGEAGIGKTAVAEELAVRASDEGVTVLWGRCWEWGGAPAYWPWTQVLRGLLRSLDPDEFDGVSLTPILPELGEAMPELPVAAPGASEVARFRLFDSLSTLFRRVSEDTPMLVVLEDLHAADVSSLLLLRFLAEEIRSMQLLLVATYRDSELARSHHLASALPELMRSQTTGRLTLSGLSEADAAKLIQAISGRISPELVSKIHRGTEGNPLFMRELVVLLSAEGRLEVGVKSPRWPVPGRVRDVIAQRFDRLPEDCKRMLMIGSVVGRDFRVEVLARTTGRSTEVILDSLHDAMTARIVVAVEDDPGRFRFTHVLLREFLYNELMPADRTQTHRAVGEALEVFYAGDRDSNVAEIAHHFVEAAPAGNLEKAVDYAAAAGKRALALLAYEEGVRLFQLALRMLRGSQEDERQCDVLLLLGEAQSRSGDTPASKETFVAAAEVASRRRLPQHLAIAALGYAGPFPWVRAGTDHRLVPLLSQALEALESGDSVVRVRLLSRMAGALRDQPSAEPRASLAGEAVAMARRIGDPETLAYALLAQWAAVFMGPDGLYRHTELGEELDRLVEQVGDRELAMYVHGFRFSALMSVGQVAEARIQHGLASRVATELRQPSHRWLVGLLNTLLAFNDGRFQEAERLMDETFEAGQRAQAWDAAAARLFASFMLRREQARLAEVEDEIRRAPVDYPGYRSLPCMLLVILCDLGRLDEARNLFERLAEDDFAGFPKDTEWLFALTLLAEAAYRLADYERTRSLYEQLQPYASLVAWLTNDACAGPVSRPLGMMATLLGHHEDAIRHFKTATEHARRMESRPWIAHAQYAYAEMLAERRRQGDRGTATRLLTATLQECDELGMVMLGRRVRGLQARLGVRPQPGGTDLTPREREVVGLVADALSNRQIAERLYISERTVESHVRNILTKLGMKSRTEVASWALKQGLNASGSD